MNSSCLFDKADEVCVCAGVYDEVAAMKQACGDSAHLKVILATGELGSLVNVHKASMAAMMAGQWFLFIYFFCLFVCFIYFCPWKRRVEGSVIRCLCSRKGT